jgi:thioester reductase-like protein
MRVRTYFITGATGVVGSAVLAALLEHPDTRFRLLIRAPSDEALNARLVELLGSLRRQRDPADGRVTGLRGDATLPRFGLDEAAYQRLAAECTHVIHAAASVRMNLPLDVARASAVTAVEHVLAFCTAAARAGALQKAELVSTVGVGGRWHGALPERWIDEPRFFHNTYEQSKAEAETVVARAIAAGLPATVHRPSMVVGDSRTGRIPHFQVFYHLAEFIAGRRTFGLLPPLAGRTVDLVPSDFVAAAIAWSSTAEAALGKVLHLCAGPAGAVPLEWLRDEVRRRIRDRGLDSPRIRSVPPALLGGIARLAAPFVGQRTRRALSTLPIFLDYLGEEQVFSNQATSALLARIPIELPRAAAFLGPVLDYYLDTRYGRKP